MECSLRSVTGDDGGGSTIDESAKWKVQNCGIAVGDSVYIEEAGCIFVRAWRHSCDQVSIVSFTLSSSLGVMKVILVIICSPFLTFGESRVHRCTMPRWT